MWKCELCGQTFSTPQGLSAHKRWVHEGRRPEPRATERADRAWADIYSQYQSEAGLQQQNGQVDWGKLIAWGFIGWLIYKAIEQSEKTPSKRRRKQ